MEIDLHALCEVCGKPVNVHEIVAGVGTDDELKAWPQFRYHGQTWYGVFCPDI